MSLLLQAIWAFRIYRAGRARTYPATFTYLLFNAASGGLILLASANPSLELVGYLVARPLIWILLFAVVHEMFRVLASQYEGLRRLGQLILYGAIGSLALFFALVFFGSPYSAQEVNRYYRLWLLQEQSVYLATAIGVLATIIIGRVFALPMSRNLRTILGTLGIYFLGMGAMIVLRSYLGSQWNHVLDAAGLGLYCVCLGIGVAMYSRAGDRVEQDPRLARREDHLRALGVATNRLEEVNLQLVRVLAK